ncbi:MAG: alanine/ornithine racemase family PLP-dependent enzyme [Alphaproteobacteria bacterium]|nr:alanine/ornithine racemase family PLP-dependent enzyme [Alphaproteobacteria bacterium]
MTAPRLEINFDKILHNTATLTTRLMARGISVTGVTKATLGNPEIADVLLQAGVQGIGESRIENIEAMRQAGVNAEMILLRSPMMSQVDRVVAQVDISHNTELDVINQLSIAASITGRVHGVILMVELGDLREGIMPDDLEHTVRETLRFPNIRIRGIGTNLACRSGVSPDIQNMNELSELANSIDSTFGPILDIVSGGNSGNLDWAFSGANIGRINNLRLGESLLFGVETLHREPIDGLHTDAITLVAEIIESKDKPSIPRGVIAQTAFGTRPPDEDRGTIAQSILAIGRQDIDPDGLLPPTGITVLGASSDHLTVDTGTRRLPIGSEITFQLNYSALLRAMTSPFVSKVVTTR